MPRTRKKKIPITQPVADASARSSNTSKATRFIIRRFHILIKRRAQLHSLSVDPRTSESASTAVARHGELEKIEEEIDALGGLEEYQRMSAVGQGEDRGGGTEKVLIEWMGDLGLQSAPRRKVPGRNGKLRLLEVGALKPDNYHSCTSWIDVTPIDLHSRHPEIMEQDFLLMDGTAHCGQWDVISLSLVVNFVPEAKARGQMLRMAHEFLGNDGLLFLTLPLPCVINSRYITLEHLRSLMEAIGFTQLKERWRAGGKMAYWLYSKSIPRVELQSAFAKKTVLLQGQRNNFCILL